MKNQRIDSSPGVREFMKLLLCGLVISGIIISGCQSSPPPQKQGPPVEFVLKCSSGTAIREHRQRKDDTLREAGPVLLPTGLNCQQAAELPEDRIRKFQRHGLWREYYSETGQVLSQVEFKNNQKNGAMSFYSKEGQVTRVEHYVDNRKAGQVTRYFAESGEWRSKGQYVDGQKVGPWQERLAPGSGCISQGDYQANYRSGPWEECSLTAGRNAQSYLSFKGSYINGVRHDAAQHFFPDGQLQAAGHYTLKNECLEKEKFEKSRIDNCSLRSGEWVIYHNNGQKALQGRYSSENGKKIGEWIEYYRSGEKMAEGQRNHTRQGDWSFYAKNGKLLGRYNFAGSDNFIKSGTIYKNGVKVAESLPGKNCRQQKNPLGRLVENCESPEGGFLSALVKYDESRDELVFKFTMKIGRWAFYDASGQKSSEGVCQNGRRVGAWQIRNGGALKTIQFDMMSSERCP